MELSVLLLTAQAEIKKGKDRTGAGWTRQVPSEGCVGMCVHASSVEKATLRTETGPRYLGSPEKNDKKSHFMPKQACFLQVQEERQHVVLGRLITMRRSKNV